MSDDDVEWHGRELAVGDDSPPLMKFVHDQPYVRGSLTSVGRTASAEYRRFLNKHKEVQRGDERR